MNDVAVQLVDPEDSSVRNYPRTLAHLVATANGSNVDTELNNRPQKNGTLTNDHIAIFDSGNIKDSGKSTSDFTPRTITNTAGNIVSGDRVCVVSGSNNHIERKNAVFDGSSRDYALSKDGKFEKFIFPLESINYNEAEAVNLSVAINDYFTRHEQDNLDEIRNFLFHREDQPFVHDTDNYSSFYYNVFVRAQNNALFLNTDDVLLRILKAYPNVRFKIGINFPHTGNIQTSHYIVFNYWEGDDYQYLISTDRSVQITNSGSITEFGILMSSSRTDLRIGFYFYITYFKQDNVNYILIET